MLLCPQIWRVGPHCPLLGPRPKGAPSLGFHGCGGGKRMSFCPEGTHAFGLHFPWSHRPPATPGAGALLSYVGRRTGHSTNGYAPPPWPSQPHLNAWQRTADSTLFPVSRAKSLKSFLFLPPPTLSLTHTPFNPQSTSKSYWLL